MTELETIREQRDKLLAALKEDHPFRKHVLSEQCPTCQLISTIEAQIAGQSVMSRERGIHEPQTSLTLTGETQVSPRIQIIGPCPHCGVEEHDHDEGAPFLGTAWGEDGWYIGCSNCGAKSGERSERYLAIEAWNQRATRTTEEV